MIDKHNILSIIDHTLLKADASKEQIIQLCQEAIHYGAATVFTHGFYTPLVAEQLAGIYVRGGGDLVHGNDIRVHAPQQHHGRLAFPAAAENIGAGPQIKTRFAPGQRRHLSPLIAERHFLSAAGKAAYHIPQEGRLPSSRRGKDQR